MSIRLSSIILLIVFAALFLVLIELRETLLVAHVDGTILNFSSDASVYFKWYDETYSKRDILDNWKVFLRASPILLMMLSDGNLFLIQIFNLLVISLSLFAATNCFQTFRGRALFLILSLMFPYFSLGFLSLNKEVYAMSAAILYGSYMIRGRILHLVLAFMLALMARYYMLASLAMLVATIPRRGRPQWLLIIAALIAISAIAPLIKQLIPEYSYEELLKESGSTAVMLASIVDNFGYAIVYCFKYLILLLVRPYGYLIGTNQDAIGAFVSICSTVAFVSAIWIFLSKRLDLIEKQLIVAGLVAPIPMMWSEIMHWRYYSFVYFFFLYALILFSERRRSVAKHLSYRTQLVVVPN